ncbi:hypothetical protein KI688_002300 [Linnemannia hyalina]|uniref:FHA domain-containing protein n=1 Tax=Linnemannia hyalina TaxID=64524 RepID=A0A9P7XSM3_9FUNG|nr:hypothetical protein KI688_002300 [Linnemannia hyalina]
MTLSFDAAPDYREYHSSTRRSKTSLHHTAAILDSRSSNRVRNLAISSASQKEPERHHRRGLNAAKRKRGIDRLEDSILLAEFPQFSDTEDESNQGQVKRRKQQSTPLFVAGDGNFTSKPGRPIRHLQFFKKLKTKLVALGARDPDEEIIRTTTGAAAVTGGGTLAQGRRGVGHLKGQDPDPYLLHQEDPIHADPILAPVHAHDRLAEDLIDHKEETQGGGGGRRGGGPRHESTFRSGPPGGGSGKPDVWGSKMAAADEEERKKKPVIAEEDKEKPNFGLSGSLAAETNTTANGTVLKYNEPPEARKPAQKWRLYVFKGDKEIDLLHIHRQSAFLFGRDRNVVDVPIEHPSCSKQHAVLQFRQIVETDALGQTKRTTKPFIIDLESANGTFVNGTKIPPTRYYELKLSDVLKFGASTREFVLLHESAES